MICCPNFSTLPKFLFEFLLLEARNSSLEGWPNLLQAFTTYFTITTTLPPYVCFLHGSYSITLCFRITRSSFHAIYTVQQSFYKHYLQWSLCKKPKHLGASPSRVVHVPIYVCRSPNIQKKHCNTT